MYWAIYVDEQVEHTYIREIKHIEKKRVWKITSGVHTNSHKVCCVQSQGGV